MHKATYSVAKRGRLSQGYRANQRACRIEAIGLIFVLGFSISASALHASEMTEDFVRTILEDGYSILNDGSHSELERGKEFQSFLSTVTAFDRTALFTLGPYANTFDDSDVATFLDSFRASLSLRVQQRFEALRDFSLDVIGSTDRAADDSVVMIDVVSTDGSSMRNASAAFRIRENAEGDPVVTDIQFEGIWLGIIAREVNMSFLARNGSNLSDLSNFLDEQRLSSALSTFLDEQSDTAEVGDKSTQ